MLFIVLNNVAKNQKELVFGLSEIAECSKTS